LGDGSVPTYNNDVIPDITGRKLGNTDKRWDGFFRDLNFTGALNGAGGGSGLGAIVNAVAGTDSLNIQSNSGDGAGTLLRMRISNPAGSQPITYLKNTSLEIGGTAGADSVIVPFRMYSAPADYGVRNYINFYRPGDAVNVALAIGPRGGITSYTPSSAEPTSFAVMRTGEAQPLLIILSTGAIAFGGGGAGVPDAGISRIAPSWLAIDNRIGGYGNLSLAFAHFYAAQGTAPMQVDSTTQVANLNVSYLAGSSWANPPTIGSSVPPDINANNIAYNGQLSANVPTGTPPFNIASRTVVENLTVKQLYDVTLDSTVNPNGTALKHRRSAIPSVAAGASVLFRITWTTPFPDANYTVVATIFDSQIVGGTQINPGLQLMRKVGQAADYAEFMITNNDPTNARAQGVLHAIGIRG
jgi:hypothetical protein